MEIHYWALGFERAPPQKKMKGNLKDCILMGSIAGLKCLFFRRLGGERETHY